MTDDPRPDPIEPPSSAIEPAAMSLDEAIHLLTYCRAGVSPAIPLGVVLDNREQATEILLAAISVSPADLAHLDKEAPDGDHIYWLHFFACHILALWQEPRAFAPLLAYLAADSHMAIEQLDDIVTETLPAILARTCDGSDLGPLKRLIENPAAEIYVRDAALRSLHAMVLLGKYSRDDLVAYGLDIAVRLRTAPNEEFANLLVSSLHDLGEPALVPMLEPWFDLGWVDRRFMRKADLHADPATRRKRVTEDLLQSEVFDELLIQLASSPWFTGQDDGDPDFDEPGYDAHGDDGPAPEPFVRAGPKVGRNDPCPCGSGKKYKKCCLDADRA